MSTAKRVLTALWTVAHSATYGYHIASLNGVQASVICTGDEGGWDCLNISDAQFGIAVTVITLGGLLGSLCADSISRRVGSVGTLRIAEAAFLIGALAVASARQLWMIIAARLLIGMASGLVLVTIPPLLSTIAPEKYRTMFGTLHQSSIGIGMIIAQSLSLIFARPKLWRVELLIAAGIAGVLLIVGLFVRVDEGNKGREDQEADERSALLGDEGEAAPGWLTIDHKKQPISVKELLITGDAKLRSGFFIVCAAQFAQQICGISPVMYFSSRILQPVFDGESRLIVLMMMAVGIPFNFLPGFLPSWIGSKRILIASAMGTSLFSLLLAIGLNAHNQALSGTAVIAFVIAFSTGLAPVAWVVLSEVVPPEARIAVGSVAVSLNWLTNFTAGTVFLPLQERLKNGDRGEGNIFYVFAGASLVASMAIQGTYKLYNRHRDQS